VSDITDEALLDAICVVHKVRWKSSGVTASTPLGADNMLWIGASIWDVAAVLDGHPEWCGQPEATNGSVQIPEKAVRAKVRNLIRRGLVNGCASHDCRGDFTILSVNG
jgi:hypothetical protein